MKTVRLLLGISLVGNLALAWAWLAGSGGPAGDRHAPAPRSAEVPATERGAPGPATATVTGDANPALRDRLRAMGFSEDEVRAAVRARIEAPRLGRQRALQAEAARAPWWRVAQITSDPLQQSQELREMRKAERAELVRLFGPGGDVTREEADRYAFLPPEKAARAAALERDYRELRHEIPAGPNAPQTAGEAAEREKLINAERERDLAALLTPEERLALERHTSFPSYTIADRARYFPATEEEYGQLLELTKAHRQAAGMDRPRVSVSLQDRIAADEKHHSAVIALLGPERFRQWERAWHRDHQALVELQRRFSPSPATVAALAALPRQVGEEGMAIAKDRSQGEAQQVAAVSELAARTREKIRGLLGADLGEAYIEATTRGWLDELDRGMVPFFQENGRRAVFMVARMPLNPNAPPPRVAPAPKR